MTQKMNVILLLTVLLVFPLGARGQFSFEEIKQFIPDKLELADSLAKQYYFEAQSALDDEKIAKGAYLLGLTNYYMGNLYISSGYYREALSTEYTRTDRDLEESCWNNLGINLDLQNNLAASLEAYRKSWEIARERNDKKGMALTQINFGLLEVKRLNSDAAMSFFQEALDFFQAEKDTLYIGLCLQNIGVVYKVKEDWEQLASYSQEALALFTKLSYHYGQIDCLINLGFAYYRMNRTGLAISVLKEALALSKEHSIRMQEAIIMKNLANVDVLVKSYQEAMAKYRLSLEISRELGLNDQIYETYMEMLSTAALSGDSGLYRELLKEKELYENERLTEEAIARYDELNIVYETEAKLREIDRQQSEIKMNQRRIVFLFSFLAVALIAILITTVLYLRTKSLMRDLYLRNEELLKRKHDKPEQELDIEHFHGPDFDDKLWQLFREIDGEVDKEELFRDRNLTLSILSKRLGSNETYISKAINTYSNTNFNGYINHYRVLAAQKLLTGSNNEFTMKAIGEYCGFNSHSTFVRIFKQITGLTPSEYLIQAKSKK